MEDKLLNLFEESVSGDVVVRREFNGIVHFVSYNDSDDYEFRYVIQNGEVIVSRVNLGNKRNGIFTKMMRVFMTYKEEYNIHLIRIQSVSTDAMYNWCLKNGYSEVGNGWGGILHGDFVLKI